VSKMSIPEAIKRISNGVIQCESKSSAIITLYLLLDMGFTHVSLEE
jgi:hypothetical protein